MTDIEQRAQRLMNDIRLRKLERKADEIFREPGRKMAKEQAKKEAAEREQKEIEDRWSPWIAKAQQRMQHEQLEREKLINRI